MTDATPPEADWQVREQLHLAAADGDIATVGALLAAGADVRAFDRAARRHDAAGPEALLVLWGD